MDKKQLNWKMLEDRYSRIFHRKMPWRIKAEVAIAATHRVELLMARLKNQFFSHFGLASSAEFQVLTACYDRRDGFPQSELVITLEARPGTVSALLQRMEAARLVEIKGLPKSKRGNLVVLTAKGLDVFERAHELFLRWIPELFDENEIESHVRLLSAFEDRIKLLSVNEAFISALYEQQQLTEGQEDRMHQRKRAESPRSR